MAFIDNPELLRIRAAEMRGRSEKAVYPEAKRGLLRIAQEYDVLATRAEHRLAVLSKQAEGDDQRAGAAVVDANARASQFQPETDSQK